MRKNMSGSGRSPYDRLVRGIVEGREDMWR